MADENNTAAPSATTDTSTVLSDNNIESRPTDNSSNVTTPAESTAPAASPVPEKFLKEDGTPDYEKLAKSYTELEKTLRTTRPSAPKSIEEYKLEGFKYELDEELTKAFKEDALAAGLSVDQYKWVMDRYAGVVESFMPGPEKTTADLKQVWGEDFQTNLSAAQRAWKAYGEGINEALVGNNPEVLKLLARIGAEMSEDSARGTPASRDPGLTMTEVNELMARPDYWTNQEIQKKVQSYFASRGK